MTTMMLFASLTFIGLSIWLIYIWTYNPEGVGLFQKSVITLITLVIAPILLVIELPKIKIIELDTHGLNIVTPIFRKTVKFGWEQLDGYETGIYLTKGGLIKEIYLVADGKVVHEISESYLKNFDEIHRIISRKLKKLGSNEFSPFKYLRRKLFS